MFDPISLGVMALGSGLSYGLSQMNQGGKSAQAGGYQWNATPENPLAKRLKTTQYDYLANGLDALAAGKPPTWFQQYRPLEEAQRKNALSGQYYGAGAGAAGSKGYAGYGGSGGNAFAPGVFKQQQAADVAAGRRGSGGGSNYAKQLALYQQQMQDIDNYLSQMGAASMQTAEQTYLQGAQGVSQYAQGSWGGFDATEAQASPYQQIGSAVGAMTPYFASMMGQMGGGSSQYGQALNSSTGAQIAQPLYGGQPAQSHVYNQFATQ
jgi:hypothetical protein